MAAPKRPSLTNLAVQKPAPATAVAPAEPTASSPGPAAPAAPPPAPRAPVPRRSPPDMKTVQVRINRRGWAALRRVADDHEGMTLESLMVEALNDVLLKYGQPPIVERRTGERGTEGREEE